MNEWETKAVIVIQKRWRGFRDWKRVKKLKEQKSPVKEGEVKKKKKVVKKRKPAPEGEVKLEMQTSSLRPQD